MPFKRPTTTPTPDELYDEWLPVLGEAELRALLYIVRRTLGFKKNADAISFKQFLEGITTKDGQRLDGGCGIKNRTNLSKALAKLEERGLIRSHRMSSKERGDLATVYTLWFEGDPPGLGVINDPRSAPLAAIPEGLSTPTGGPATPAAGPPSNRSVGEYRNSTRGEGGEYRKSTRGVEGEYRGSTPRSTSTVRAGVPQQHPQETVKQQTGFDFDSMPPSPVEMAGKHPAAQAGPRRRVHPPPAGVGEDAAGSVPDASAGEAGSQPDDPAYQTVADLIAQLGGELGDEVPRSSVTRAYNHLRGSDVPLDDFLHLLKEAKVLTLSHKSGITKLQMGNGAAPRKNMMPYFFTTLANLLDPAQQPARQVGAGAWPRTRGRGKAAPMAAGGISEGAEGDIPVVTESHPVWRSVLEDLRETLTPANYTTWFAPTRVLAEEGDLLHVEVKNSFAQYWIGERLRRPVERTLASLGYPDLRVEFVAAAQDGAE